MCRFFSNAYSLQELFKSTEEVKTGTKTLKCTFNLIYKDLKLNEKKSKVKCSPRVKKSVDIPNYSISGDSLIFSFDLKIMKNGKVILSNSALESSAATESEPTGMLQKLHVKKKKNVPLEQNCSFGFTEVCSNDPKYSSSKRSLFCPKSVTINMKKTDKNATCACLQTRMVEQDVESGISPLGKNHKGCVYLELDLMYPNLAGEIHK